MDHDYIVVGAGSAGSVIASALADAGHSVCVVEAGRRDRNMFIRMPAGFVKTIANPRMIWPFATEPSPWTGNRAISLPQGRVVGGSGAINGMLFVRGQAQDFESWKAMGAAGWGYDDLLPYFRRLERRVGGKEDDNRGRDGPQPVTDPRYKHPLSAAYIQAAATTGLRENADYNGFDQAGIGYYQLSIEHGWRVNSAHAWLARRVRAKKIHLVTETLATRILIRDRRAVGILIQQDGEERVMTARKEIVLSAGAINSPRLLMLSGIGPGETLRAAGIEPVVARDGVGRNLRDHYTARIVARINGATTINNIVNSPLALGYQACKWLLGFPSLLGTGPASVGGFGASGAEGARPDYMLMFAPASYRAGHVGKLDRFAGITCGAWQLRPHSSGEVRIVSPDPHALPIIQPNYLQADHDRAVLLAALRHQRRILSAAPLQRYAPVETLPGKDCASDDDLTDFARQHGSTSYHPVGTCRMGRREDPLAVLDPHLRVIGVDRLRVVDASAMPTMTSGNTYAPTLAIAARAADLMLGSAGG